VSDYFDRQGRPITHDEWAAMADQKRVAEAWVGQLWVSTVWLGLNHSYAPDGPPIIFETMVFPRWDFADLFSRRYATEAEALAGHREAVAWARTHAHGLVKHARDQKRSDMKRTVQLLERPGRTELDDVLLRLQGFRVGRRPGR
jgi:hypothetical protein